MKIRIKVYQHKKPLVIELEKTNKVSQLIEKVSRSLEEQFHIKDKEFPITLSLNGREPMIADVETFVEELGLVSGDLLYLLNVPPLAGANEKPLKNTAEALTKPRLASPAPDLHPKLRKMEEPLQIHESRLNAYPPNLQHFVDHHSPLLQTPLEFLAAVFHILMLETGFWPGQHDPYTDTDLYLALPEKGEWVGGCMQLNYRSSLSPHATCTLTVMSLGPYSLTRGTSALLEESFGAKFPVADYATTSDYQKVEFSHLHQLSLEFKDKVTYPLLIALQDVSGGCLPPMLTNLPAEITFTLLCKLDLISCLRLGQTCRQFKIWLSDLTFWKHLFMRDFSLKNVRDQEIEDWKRLYKQYWLANKEIEKNTRALCVYGSLLPIFPGSVGPDLIPIPLPHFPGMIGGDEDRFPNILERPNRLRLPNPFPIRPPVYRPNFGGGGAGFHMF